MNEGRVIAIAELLRQGHSAAAVAAAVQLADKGKVREALDLLMRFPAGEENER